MSIVDARTPCVCDYLDQCPWLCADGPTRGGPTAYCRWLRLEHVEPARTIQVTRTYIGDAALVIALSTVCPTCAAPSGRPCTGDVPALATPRGRLHPGRGGIEAA